MCLIIYYSGLAERSSIIIQNSSNPSSRKNLDVRPYKVLLLTCVVNCTAGTPTPRLCPVVQWSVHWAPSRTTRVIVLAGARRCALGTCGRKKCELRLYGLAKSIYYKTNRFNVIVRTCSMIDQRIRQNRGRKSVKHEAHVATTFCRHL